jgi:hypothetical protein
MQSDHIINLGRWSRESIERLLAAVHPMTPAYRISFISKAFMTTPYKQATLVGDGRTEERLVINLAEVDCFTFLDYVEALRRSSTFHEFINNVREVRYRSGVLGYATRNHFFTDWIEQNDHYVNDITEEIGREAVRTIKKRLNRKEDGTAFVQDLLPFERAVTYLPVNALFGTLELRNGDYLGVYSPFEGLDVSHTGIVIEDQGSFVFRHASSQEDARQVIDQDLMNYLKNKPGIIILRPR